MAQWNNPLYPNSEPEPAFALPVEPPAFAPVGNITIEPVKPKQPNLVAVDYDPFDAAAMRVRKSVVDGGTPQRRITALERGIEATTNAVHKAIENDKNQGDTPLWATEGIAAKNALSKLLGTDGQERYQMWPEKMLRSAATLPDDVVTGKVKVPKPGQSWEDFEAEDPEGAKTLIGRVGDYANLAIVGGVPMIMKNGVKGMSKNTLGSTAGAGAFEPSVTAATKAPTFYSAVENAVVGNQQAKMTGDQWLGTLKNSKGVKPEEMEWLGLNEFLADKKGPVTKQEMQDFIASNKVELKEVQKGGEIGTQEKAFELAKEHGWKSWDEIDAATQRKYIQRASKEGGEIPTKYHNYQLPGGENYREVLLTLPAKENYGVKLAEGKYRLFDYKTNDYVRNPDGKIRTGYDSETAAKEAATGLNQTSGLNPMGNYQSSHWDEPNILAHIRVNDRTMPVEFTPQETLALQAHENAQVKLNDIRKAQGEVAKEISAMAKPLEKARREQILIDNAMGRLSNSETAKKLEEYESPIEIKPLQDKLSKLREEEDALRASLPKKPEPTTKKSLHLEEIQSDWHQTGRDKGYKDRQAQLELQKLEVEKDEFLNSLKDQHGKYYTRNALSNEEIVRVDGYRDRIGELSKRIAGVPDAPFKKSWHELALKRMIREAAEKGYDRLSWTPGEAQAARYDLSKSVDNVHYSPNQKKLIAKKDGKIVISQENVTPEKLPDIVGKEAANKLLSDEYTTFKGSESQFHELQGEQLKIGGEGMKGFYDQIIPKSLEKLGKEFGVKVQKGGVSTKNYQVVEAPRNQWAVLQDGEVVNYYPTKERATEVMEGKKSKHPDTPIFYIEIPQPMKDTALRRGFPLFSSGVPLIPVDHDPFKE